jgi:hypothetical protein
VVCDSDGSVVLFEKYFHLEEVCANGPLTRSETYNSQGRLIEVQEPHKLSYGV